VPGAFQIFKDKKADKSYQIAPRFFIFFAGSLAETYENVELKREYVKTNGKAAKFRKDEGVQEKANLLLKQSQQLRQ